MHIHVSVLTYDRPELLKALVADLQREIAATQHRITATICDDHSPGCATQEVVPSTWTYERASTHYGKERFWKWTSLIYRDLKSIVADRYVFLPDDVRLCSGFFAEAESVWSIINDESKIALNLMVDDAREFGACWTSVETQPMGAYDLVGWVDGAIYCERSYLSALGFSIEPINPRRWDGAPELSSGVGQQISIKFAAKDLSMYRVQRSLIRHVSSPSKMHPQERRRNPLRTLRFFGDEDVNAEPITASLATVPGRVVQLEQAVQSLLPQVDTLFVQLNSWPTVPSFLGQSDKITVSKLDEGCGDDAKFWHAFSVGQKPGWYLSCDDDLAYGPHYVRRLIWKAERYERLAVVGLHGAVFPYQINSFARDRKVFHCLHELKEDKRVHLLGTGALCYHTSTIQISHADFRSQNMADIWFAIAAQKQHVPMICAAHKTDALRYLLKPTADTIWDRMKRDGDAEQTKLVQDAAPWRIWTTQ